jgi:hypothetical protein
VPNGWLSLATFLFCFFGGFFFDYNKQLMNLNKAYVMKMHDSKSDANSAKEQWLFLTGKIAIHHQNTRHKPHLPLEKSHIKGLGGWIHVPLLHPKFSRVIVHKPTNGKTLGWQ